MADDLRIDIVVNAAQVQAGMQQAGSSVQAASSQITAALNPAVASAVALAKQLMATGQTAQQAAAQMRTVGVAAATVQAAFQAINAAGAQAAVATTQVGSAAATTTAQITSLDRAMAVATGRMAGMAAGAGGLGGALGRVAAQSSVLGPILSRAFPIFAIIAFIDIAEMARDKIIEVTSSMAGWDKEAKAMYDLLLKLNQQTLNFNYNLAIEKLRLNEIGLKGSALEVQKESNAKSELKIRTDELVESLRREDSIRQALEGTKRTVYNVNPITGQSDQHTAIDLPDKDEAERLNKELRDAIENSERLRQQILKLQQVEIPGDRDKAKVEQQQEYERALERSAEFNDKLVADTKRLAEEDLKALDARKRLEDEAEKALNHTDTTDDDLRGMRLQEQAQEQFNQARLADAKESAITEIEIQQDKAREFYTVGKISGAQLAQQLNDLEAQKLQIETAYLQKRIDEVLGRMKNDDAQAYAEDIRLWSRLLSEKQKAEDTFEKNRQKNIATAATNEEKLWQRMAQGIDRTFASAIQGMVSGTERLSTAFGRIIDTMLAKFIEALVQMLEQWIITHVLMVNVKKATQAQEVLSDAKGAAAAAWKATAGIPVIGPILAPIAAATAFAGVEAFSAAGGWDVPGNIPSSGALSLIHPNEMVLPRELADKVRYGSGNAGGHTINISYGNISAIDASGIEEVLRNNSQAVVKAVRKELRRGNAI